MSRAVEAAAASAKSCQESEDNPESFDIDIDGENLLGYLSAVRILTTEGLIV